MMSLSSSDRNRDTLGMDEFFAFDGDPDRGERVTVDYLGGAFTFTAQ